MKNIVWESMDDWNSRTKVFGGWIVKTTEPVFHLDNSQSQGGEGWDWRIATCFVPDPNGEWILGEEKEKEEKTVQTFSQFGEDGMYDTNMKCDTCTFTYSASVDSNMGENEDRSKHDCKDHKECDHPWKSNQWNAETRTMWCTLCNEDTGIPF